MEKQNLTPFNSTFAKCTHQMQHYHCVVRETGVLSCTHKCWHVQSQNLRELLWQKWHHHSRVLDWLLESRAQFLSDSLSQCLFRTCTFLNFNCSTMTVAPGPVHRWSPGGEKKTARVFVVVIFGQNKQKTKLNRRSCFWVNSDVGDSQSAATWLQFSLDAFSSLRRQFSYYSSGTQKLKKCWKLQKWFLDHDL